MFSDTITTKQGLGGTRLKTPILCFQHEPKRVSITKQARFHFGIEDVEVFGEPKMLLPKPLEIKCKRKLILFCVLYI
ncbi:hypothetical protein MPTK1_6g03690 [Marchantia polymorpha subsp. ruderalis]|uniref:Uncharacterized protein n=2 Tax=Marchantia polymorpha TaxID=3197 RepID=A0AAF6BN80_MARPO|nr:hypothetical protein MARPO_0035s0148 [Marchantia polymorpha]BBN13464.1 hypothetical protein Mp_6g03690 [Marchantia polymorpha subsp. ruderalis]|eukprot:PTQ41384.1 hypothetical protein MARPO_0035s0148 [Marchantia polymorpha]